MTALPIDPHQAELAARVVEIAGPKPKPQAMVRAAFQAGVEAERARAAAEVRALHVEQVRYSYDDGETSYPNPEDGEGYTTFSVCAECGRIEIREGEDPYVSEGLTYHESLWPCATIKALDGVQS